MRTYPTHTQVGFVARHAMITKVRGTFTDLVGTASSGEGLEGATLSLTIGAASVDTRNADRDAHLRGEDFFDVEKFPEITFRSTSITSEDPESARVEGELTIKDVPAADEAASVEEPVVEEPVAEVAEPAAESEPARGFKGWLKKVFG